MRRTSLAVVLCASTLCLGGCRTWQTADVEPVALFRADPPERVRVTRADGTRLVLETPVIRAGAMVATTAPGAVLLEDIRQVELRGVDVPRTIAFLLPGALIIFLVATNSCRC